MFYWKPEIWSCQTDINVKIFTPAVRRVNISCAMLWSYTVWVEIILYIVYYIVYNKYSIKFESFSLKYISFNVIISVMRCQNSQIFPVHTSYMYINKSDNKIIGPNPIVAILNAVRFQISSSAKTAPIDDKKKTTRTNRMRILIGIKCALINMLIDIIITL